MDGETVQKQDCVMIAGGADRLETPNVCLPSRLNPPAKPAESTATQTIACHGAGVGVCCERPSELDRASRSTWQMKKERVDVKDAVELKTRRQPKFGSTNRVER